MNFRSAAIIERNISSPGIERLEPAGPKGYERVITPEQL